MRRKFLISSIALLVAVVGLITWKPQLWWLALLTVPFNLLGLATIFKKPYSASILNLAGMSFGSISKNATLAFNGGAKVAKYHRNTMEALKELLTHIGLTDTKGIDKKYIMKKISGTETKSYEEIY